jgi:hypothetical protein
MSDGWRKQKLLFRQLRRGFERREKETPSSAFKL